MTWAWLLVSLFTVVELNCENLFDTRHDSLKQDWEFLPASDYHWTPSRYWRKLNHIGQDILSCGMVDSQQVLPDLVVLTEVENDSVMYDLTHRSMLRSADYAYVMTDSPDVRGIDVALLYSPFTFKLLHHHSIRIPRFRDFRPTRDILYVCGQVMTGDTLHIFAVHAPSRAGGEAATRPYRQHVAHILGEALDSLRRVDAHAQILVLGDFNDYSSDVSLRYLCAKNMTELSAHAHGSHGAKGTYRYQGEWGSLDHIFCSSGLLRWFRVCEINDAPFLLDEDKKYGGVKPRRNYLGPRYLNGYSDHLPLVALFDWDREEGEKQLTR